MIIITGVILSKKFSFQEWIIILVSILIGFLIWHFSANKDVLILGAFAPEELPAHIKGEFGLVWDGNSLNDSTGYMRFNNPHKMSLYLASGLPVIVWDKAATAEYVENNRVGITIGSLTDLNSRLDNISKDEYVIYQQNAMNIAKKLREGFYTHSAIQSVERIVK